MHSGLVSGAARGAIPERASATISVRAVADQDIFEVVDPAFAFELRVQEETAQQPCRTPPDHPAVAALHEAMRFGSGFAGEPGRIGNAGGGPAGWLTDKGGAPILFFGTGLLWPRCGTACRRLT